MARYTFLVLVALALIQLSMAFMPTSRLPAINTRAQVASSRTMSSSTRKRAVGALSMAKDYWEGEWVCADCGYIYDRDLFNGMPFEDQK